MNDERTAVLYARVSSKEQEEGFSIDAQLKLLRDYAQAKGYVVIREFVEAETAKRSGRRAFGELVGLIGSRKVQAIIVEKTDRIYRNLKDRVTIDELDVELHLVKEGEVLTRNSKSHAKFIHDIKLVVAKNYIDNLSEETRKGMLEKARQGLYPSVAPLGYVNVMRGARRVIEVDPVRGPLVVKLFQKFAEGQVSVKGLSKYAFEIGLRSRKGKRVGKGSLWLILVNPTYYGVVHWAGETHQGLHPPLTSRETFDQVQDILYGRRRNNSGYGTKDFAYKGMFKCGYCGCAMTAELKKGKYVYYHCTANRGNCPHPFIREEVLTEHFAAILSDLRITDEVAEWISVELRRTSALDAEQMNAQIDRLSREESRLKSRLESIYLDMLDDRLSQETYQSVRKRTEDEIAEVRLAQARLRAEDAGRIHTKETVLEHAKTASVRFKSANNLQKRELLQNLCSNCSYTERNVQVSLRQPFDMMIDLSRRNAKIEEWLPAKDSNLD